MKGTIAIALLAAGLAGAPAGAAVQYYVDPVNGVDPAVSTSCKTPSPNEGSEGAPWKTVACAIDGIQARHPASQRPPCLRSRAKARMST